MTLFSPNRGGGSSSQVSFRPQLEQLDDIGQFVITSGPQATTIL
jgi:hypothetical protein